MIDSPFSTDGDILRLCQLFAVLNMPGFVILMDALCVASALFCVVLGHGNQGLNQRLGWEGFKVGVNWSDALSDAFLLAACACVDALFVA